MLEFIIVMAIMTILAPFLLISARRTMNNLTSDDDDLNTREYFREKKNRRTVVCSILSGVAAGAICASLQFLPVEVAKWLAILFLLVLLFAAAQLCRIWHMKHESQKEWLQALWLLLPAAGVVWLLRSAVMGVRLWFDNPFWSSVFGLIPWLVGVSIVGFFTASALYLRADDISSDEDDEDEDDDEEDDDDEDEDDNNDADDKSKRRYIIFGRIAIAATKLILILLLIFGIAWGSIPHGPSTPPGVNPGGSTEPATEVQTEQTEPEEFWCVFYNDDLQEDSDSSNDLNFAPNYWKQGMSPIEARNIHQRLSVTDVTNGTTLARCVDKSCGTRYMDDQFYVEYDGKDDVAINNAIEKYIDHQGLFNRMMSAMWTFLEERATVVIREIDENCIVKDQFFQHPGRMTVRGIPDVVAYETDAVKGHLLVYIITLKNGATEEIAFRIECGFQPVNVSDYLDVTVKSSNEKPSGGGGNSPQQDSTEPGKGSVETQPATEPGNSNLKDKSKGTQGQIVGQNDNATGEGRSTNTGRGSSTSAGDNAASAGGSTTSSKSDYDRRRAELNEADNASRSGGSGSSNSTSGSSGTTTDGNGEDTDRASGDSGVASAISGDADAQIWDGSGI